MQYRHEFGLTDIPAPLRHLYFQWTALKQPGRIPELSQIKFDVLLEEDHALVVAEVVRDEDGNAIDFVVIFVGAAVSRASQSNIVGQRLSEVPGKGPGSNIWDLYQVMASQRDPVLAALDYVGPNPEFHSTRQILCPLRGEDGTQTVQFILADVMLSEEPVPNRPEDLRWTGPR
ncbi:hypothetical protein [Pacificoceanicola onchidii]|uniref:hypothetical protein n=1 Tax=Pacificoceanicola onchidii TaxID=2562685 RepID=UPI0010A2FB3B|nr:hypothetical protein [Pacificoceanicola onchidii]